MFVCVYESVHVSVCVCERVGFCVYVHVCAHVCVCVCSRDMYVGIPVYICILLQRIRPVCQIVFCRLPPYLARYLGLFGQTRGLYESFH